MCIRDRPYNRHLGGLRAMNWAEVEKIVIDLATDHGLPVQGQIPGVDAGADRLDRRLRR